MTPRIKRLLYGAIPLILAGSIGLYFVKQSDTAPVPVVQQTAPKPKPKNPTPQTIRLTATGDMLPHDTVNQQARLNGEYDYTGMFSNVTPFIRSDDINFCNQESPSAPSLSVNGYPTFNAPPAFARDLSKIGCNVINLANNHANDRGQTGIDQTLTVWDSLSKLAIAGTARTSEEQAKISFFEKSGLQFAFLSYTQCSNSKNVSSYGLNMLDKTLVSQQVAAAKQQADIIIVGTHWCRENQSKEDNDQAAWGEYLASQGVDIVIGTGPHVLQPVRKLPKAGGGETIDWYSLGNFLSSQEGINGLIGGIAYMDIDVQTKTVTKLSFLPTYMHYEWTAAEQASGNLLARKNLALYPLDQAASQLAASRLGATVESQTSRVTALLNTYTPVTILTSATAPRQN